MANFEWLDDNINDVFEKIYNNQNLCKLLYYDDDNPYIQPDILNTKVLHTDKNKQKLFPYFFTPDVSDDFKTTLHICFKDFKLSNNIMFKPAKVDFCIVCHEFLWELNLNDNKIHLRPFAILQEIDKTFNRQRTLGLGINNFSGLHPIYYNDKFSGFICSYEWVDFT
jgi:hypothetical protein